MRKTSGLNSTNDDCGPREEEFDDGGLKGVGWCFIKRGGSDEEQARHKVVFGFICDTLDC